MKIAIVLVVYQKKISELPFFALLPDLLAKGVPVLCYDNSAQPQTPPFTDSSFFYQHDPRNLGVTAGYQAAFEKFKEDYDGLLLLDQDSEVSLAYLNKLLSFSFIAPVVALVPRVFAGTQQISPVSATAYINRDSQMIAAGRSDVPIMAINSGALISMAFLKKIGGFNLDFPLDFADHWLFATIYAQHQQVEVAQATMQHDLSVRNYQTLSKKRYQNILQAENLFYQKYAPQFLAQHLHQLKRRIVKQLFFVRRWDLAKVTLHEWRHLKRGEQR